MANQGRKTLNRGFTLIELVIAIAVIAILAAILVPTILGVLENSKKAVAMELVSETAKTMKRFHDDTGYWPLGNGVWVPLPGGSPQQDPTEFNDTDTVMFKADPPDVSAVTVAGVALPQLPHCKADKADGQNCFNGPYLSPGGSLGSSGMRDPWGNPLRYTYIRPFDGFGGTSAFPSGFVAVWSAGPDRLDATGCFSTAAGAKSAGCAYDLTKISRGKPSVDGADDIVRFVGAAL